MSSSYYGGLVDFDASQIGGSGDPVDTALVADSLVNNTQHAIDEQCQPLASWVCPLSPSEPFEPVIVLPDTPYFVTTIGMFPLQLLPDGSCPKIIARIECGYSGGGPATVTFYLVLRPARSTQNIFTPGMGASWEGSAAFTVGSPVVWSDVLELRMSDAQVAAATQTIATVSSAGATAGYSAELAMAQIDVYAATDDITQTPQLYGWSVREYYGGP